MDQWRRDKPATAPPAQPGEGVIEAPAELRQIEHRFLDPGPRRGSGWMPDGVDPVSAVDDNSRHELVPLAGANPNAAVMTDSDVDDTARPVGQPVKLGRRVMAERRTRPTAQDAGPDLRFAPRLPRVRHIDSAIELSPAAASQPGVDDRGIEANGGSLPASDDPVLEIKQPSTVSRKGRQHGALGWQPVLPDERCVPPAVDSRGSHDHAVDELAPLSVASGMGHAVLVP
jgi:hypothetical protein